MFIKKSLLILLLLIVPLLADILVLDNGQKIKGELLEIADEYVEYKAESNVGEPEWVKVRKQDLLAIIDGSGKLAYPRDKFDENSLNYGKVKIRNRKERRIYLQRRTENQQNQSTLELREKDKYKVAALVGSLSGIMLWALIDNK